MNESQKKLLNYAAWLLARRNYHSVTLRDKMTKRGIGTEEDVSEVLEKLLENRYINDQEYVRYYIEDHMTRKPQGIRLVRKKLFQKGIKGEAVEKELQKHAPMEQERARQALLKKEKTLKAGGPHERKQKLFRFLSARGFAVDTIKAVLS